MTAVSNHQIFVFKSELENVSFEARFLPHIGMLRTDSLQYLARKIRAEIERMDFVEDQYLEFHFKTPMDIRFRPSWGFTRYTDLNEEEKEEFWKAING